MSVGWLENQRNLAKQEKNMENVNIGILSDSQFNGFVALVAGNYGLPQDQDTEEAVATAILHAPPDMGLISVTYIGARVAKMMANKVAFDRIQEIKAKREAELKAKQAETKTEVPASGTIQEQKV